MSLMAVTEEPVAAWMSAICRAVFAGRFRGLLVNALTSDARRKAAASQRRLAGLDCVAFQARRLGPVRNGVDGSDNFRRAGPRPSIVFAEPIIVWWRLRLADGLGFDPADSCTCRLISLTEDVVPVGSYRLTLVAASSERLRPSCQFLRTGGGSDVSTFG